MKWPEVDVDTRLWTVPAERMKGQVHRVPLTDDVLAILELLRALASEYVFEVQKRLGYQTAQERAQMRGNVEVRWQEVPRVRCSRLKCLSHV